MSLLHQIVAFHSHHSKIAFMDRHPKCVKPNTGRKIVNLHIVSVETENIVFDGENVVFDGEQVIG